MSYGKWLGRTISGAGGVELRAFEAGNPTGPPIVFIHGYLFSSAVFARQVEGQLGARYRLLAFDLRGHGQSAAPDDLAAYLDAQAWADDVAAVLDACDVERATFVGWSLGARVALNYAWTRGFGRIAALNLVASSLAPSSHGPDGALPPHLAGLLSEDADKRGEGTREFVAACACPGLPNQQLQPEFCRTAMQVPLAARRGARSWAIPYSGDLSWISVPVLLSQGAADPLVPMAVMQAQLRALPLAELSVLEDAGHLAFAQQPSSFDADLAKLAARAFDS